MNNQPAELYVAEDEARSLQDNRLWIMVLGVVFIVLGVIAAVLPLATALTLEKLLGWLLIISGLIEGAYGLRRLGQRRSVLDLVLAIIFLATGILLLAFPTQGVVALAVIIAASLLAQGVVRLIMAWRLRSASNWGWLLISGLLAILLGLVVFTQLPNAAPWVIGLLIGIDFLFLGLSLLMLAIRAG